MDGLLANLSPNTKAQTRSAQRGKTNFNQGQGQTGAPRQQVAFQLWLPISHLRQLGATGCHTADNPPDVGWRMLWGTGTGGHFPPPAGAHKHHAGPSQEIPATTTTTSTSAAASGLPTAAAPLSGSPTSSRISRNSDRTSTSTSSWRNSTYTRNEYRLSGHIHPNKVNTTRITVASNCLAGGGGGLCNHLGKSMPPGGHSASKGTAAGTAGPSAGILR
jgi:hypothetical protein